MHAMGVGGLAAAVVLTSFFYETANGLLISITLVITGFVCTSRIVVSDHSLKEIYTGLFVGIACQLIAYLVVM
jgi:hypothetical protein